MKFVKNDKKNEAAEIIQRAFRKYYSSRPKKINNEGVMVDTKMKLLSEKGDRYSNKWENNQ